MPLPFRAIRAHQAHHALVRRLAEAAHPKSNASLFPTFRELACFAAVLGYEQGRHRPLDAGTPTEVLVDGRIFANGNAALDILFLLGLAAAREQDILLDEPEQEERLVGLFEGYVNGGLEVLGEWLAAEPSDLDGDRAILAALQAQGYLDAHGSAGAALADAQF